MSQIEQIKKHLQSGKTLTPLDALAAFGTFRLAARVLELKNRHGMKIVTDVKQDKHGKTYAEYQEAAAWHKTHKMQVGSRVIVQNTDGHLIGVAEPGDCGRVVTFDRYDGGVLVQFNKSSRAYNLHGSAGINGKRGQWYATTSELQLMPGQEVARAH